MNYESGGVGMPADVAQDAKPAAMLDKIVALEEAILCYPQIEIPIVHHFAPGVYMREMRVKKDSVITGAIHKTEHMNILCQGEMTVMTEDGMKRLCAPAVIKSMPGIKRAAYVHEDATWITVHHNPDNERDTDKLWDLLVTNSFSEFERYMESQDKAPITDERGGK
jgi:hypothetical protein